MAVSEARAAWQRAANRCLAQEDAKRAPKLACCPSSATQQHDTNTGNATDSEGHPIPNFTPVNWNPVNSNLPPDTKWWLQLQPDFGSHKAFARKHLGEGDGSEKKAEAAGPTSKLSGELMPGEPLDINPKKSEANSEPPWKVSTTFMKHGSDTPFDPSVSKNPPNSFSDVDSPWTRDNRPEPWWRIADKDELASLVAQRATQHIDNCDLPPAQTIHVHRDPLAGLDYDRNDYNNGSIDERKWSSGGVGGLLHDKDSLYSRVHYVRSGNDSSQSKASHENEPSRAQLLEALRHSQTRAREAEMAAKKASDEKDHVVKLLLRQASHLFASKQWLKMLQLENLCLQFKIKDHQLSTLPPILPWMPSKERPSGQEKRKGKKKKSGCFCGYAVAFVVGLGLAGAGLLLGWTLGWLLPKL